MGAKGFFNMLARSAKLNFRFTEFYEVRQERFK